MSTLSSHSLFHFTHRYETIQKIIRNGFKYSIIGEKILEKKIFYTVPSISFCNIPLSSIQEHVSWYGGYGIGVSPKFAKSINATPVIYYHHYSPIIKAHFFLDTDILPYLKQTCGDQRRYRCTKRERKVFYDEKE